MPNNAYIRSTNKERQIVNAYRKEGCIAARSAGSKSPVDVWVYDPKSNTLLMIQVKTKKDSRKLVIEQKWAKDNISFEWWNFVK